MIGAVHGVGCRYQVGVYRIDIERHMMVEIPIAVKAVVMSQRGRDRHRLATFHLRRHQVDIMQHRLVASRLLPVQQVERQRREAHHDGGYGYPGATYSLRGLPRQRFQHRRSSQRHQREDRQQVEGPPLWVECSYAGSCRGFR